MKSILLILSLLITGTVFSQVDTSKQLVTLTFKEKHIEIMGDMLKRNNTLSDARVRDSLIVYLGSGTQPERVITTRLTAGFVIRFSEEILKLESGTAYNTLNELATSVAPAWPGLVAQLMIKRNQNNGEKLISAWLFNQISERFNAKANVLNEIRQNGKAWLLNPIDYN